MLQQRVTVFVAAVTAMIAANVVVRFTATVASFVVLSTVATVAATVATVRLLYVIIAADVVARFLLLLMVYSSRA